MKTVIIQENQKGFLFKNGKYKALLDAGKYHCLFGREIEVSSLDSRQFKRVVSGKCTLDTLLADPKIANQTSVIEVKENEIALHYVNDIFTEVLFCGKHAFWKVFDTHTFKIIDITDPTVDPSIPRSIFRKIPPHLYYKIEVAEYQKARLFFDRKLVKLLDSGTHYFWNIAIKVEADFVDTRLSKLEILGQEMLTADKVTLRINFVCNYRIADYVKVLTEIDSFEEQLRLSAQLALREYVGKHKLDEILENKDALSHFAFDRMKEKEKSLFVQILDAGVKDIILPGEIREIMNTVLVAEKRAQANVITRREEVASTRSLLNTAKLMEDNPTLYKLKEMEYIERICENVGNITLGGSGDMLSQLMTMLRAKEGSVN